MLTKQQKKLLSFIEFFQKEHGISPSFDEMREAMAQKSKSSVHTILNALVERGFIRKLSNRARALEVLRHPESLTSFSVRESAFRPEANLIHSPLSEAVIKGNSTFVSIPFYGSLPMVFSSKVFLSAPLEMIDLSPSFLDPPKDSDMIALKIKGDNLKEAGIHDADTVYFNMSAIPQNGDIVLALVEGDTIHLKKWEQKGNKIILSTSSKYMMPQAYDIDEVHPKGVLIGLSRNLS